MIMRIAVAMLLLSAILGCSKAYEGSCEGAYDSNAINFMAQATRALSSDLATLEGDEDGFTVYGLMAESSEWYDGLDGNSYAYDSTSQLWGWLSDEAPSWPVPFSAMNFYAYHPTSADGLEIWVSAPSTITSEIEVQPSILDQIDYLAAASGDIVSKPLTGILPLNFEHIMSKISFSMVQTEGVLTVIRQLGIENIIDKGSYDYVGEQWMELSNANLGSFDDYVGGEWIFAKYGVEDKVDPLRADEHCLMLIPQKGGTSQSQTPVWDGSITLDEDDELEPEGAYISIRYRTESDSEDLIGYAFRESCENDSQWPRRSYYYSVYNKDSGSYNGPLFVKAAFMLTPSQLEWSAGSEYDYTLYMNETGGRHLSEYYYDVDGTNTRIRISGSPELGDTIIPSELCTYISVEEWLYTSIMISD